MSSFSNLVVTAKTASALITAADAALAALANTTRIRAVTYLVPDEVRRLGSEHKLLIEYDTGGVAMSNDWQANIWEDIRFEDTIADADSFAAANPSYFVSPVFVNYLTNSRRTKPAIGLSLYNQDGVNGEANWLASGGGGGGGGSSTIDTTGITSATTVDSVKHANWLSAHWEITLERTDVSNQNLIEGIFVTHDGTTAYDQSLGQALVPAAADLVSVSVDISGSDLRLRVTPSSGTWTAKVRRLSLVPA